MAHPNLSILRGCYIFCHEDTKPRRKPLGTFFVRAACLRVFVLAFWVGEFRGLPGVEGHVALWIFRSDVLRSRPDETVVRVLLEHVRRPPRNTADGEDRREEIDWNPQRMVGRRRIEIDVR